MFDILAEPNAWVALLTLTFLEIVPSRIPEYENEEELIRDG